VKENVLVPADIDGYGQRLRRPEVYQAKPQSKSIILAEFAEPQSLHFSFYLPDQRKER